MRIIIVDSLTTEAIIGMDFLEENDCTIDIAKKCLYFPRVRMSIPFCNVTEVAQVDVTLDTSIQVPPMSEIEVMAKVESGGNTGTWLLEGKSSKGLSVQVANALVCPSSQRVPVRLLNPHSELATVHKNTRIATLEPLQEQTDESATEISAIQLEDLPEDKKQMLWGIVERCGEDLSEEQKKTFYLYLLPTMMYLLCLNKMLDERKY